MSLPRRLLSPYCLLPKLASTVRLTFVNVSPLPRFPRWLHYWESWGKSWCWLVLAQTHCTSARQFYWNHEENRGAGWFWPQPTLHVSTSIFIRLPSVKSGGRFVRNPSFPTTVEDVLILAAFCSSSICIDGSTSSVAKGDSRLWQWGLRRRRWRGTKGRKWSFHIKEWSMKHVVSGCLLRCAKVQHTQT